MPLHMRLPKLKGFRNRFRVEYQVVNVGDLGTAVPGRRRGRPGASSSRPAPSGATSRSRCSATGELSASR